MSHPRCTGPSVHNPSLPTGLQPKNSTQAGATGLGCDLCSSSTTAAGLAPVGPGEGGEAGALLCLLPPVLFLRAGGRWVSARRPAPPARLGSAASPHLALPSVPVSPRKRCSLRSAPSVPSSQPRGTGYRDAQGPAPRCPHRHMHLGAGPGAGARARGWVSTRTWLGGPGTAAGMRHRGRGRPGQRRGPAPSLLVAAAATHRSWPDWPPGSRPPPGRAPAPPATASAAAPRPGAAPSPAGRRGRRPAPSPGGDAWPLCSAPLRSAPPLGAARAAPPALPGSGRHVTCTWGSDTPTVRAAPSPRRPAAPPPPPPPPPPFAKRPGPGAAAAARGFAAAPRPQRSPGPRAPRPSAPDTAPGAGLSAPQPARAGHRAIRLLAATRGSQARMISSSPEVAAKSFKGRLGPRGCRDNVKLGARQKALGWGHGCQLVFSPGVPAPFSLPPHQPAVQHITWMEQGPFKERENWFPPDWPPQPFRLSLVPGRDW